MADKPLKPIVFDDFSQGISPSPFLGYSDMRNIDTVSRMGSARLNFQAQAVYPTAFSTTFTANAGTDIITLAGGTFQYANRTGTERPVQLTTTGTLPAGLALATTYFLIEVTSSTYKLAANGANAAAGTQIDITGTGSGTHTITSINPTLIKHFTLDTTNNNTYGLDDTGQVWVILQNGNLKWRLITGNTLTNASGNGLAYYKKFLHVFRNASVDAFNCDLTATTPSWNNAFGSLNQAAASTNTHVALAGQDDILYFADKDTTTTQKVYVGSISELSGQTYTPSSGATFTFNNKALGLPLGNDINRFTELGNNLEIGTITNFIYPWDRTSATFALPIVVQEKNITGLINLNNQMYIAAGSRGNLFKFNGYLATQFKQIPAYLTSQPTNTLTVGPMAPHNGRIYFCVTCKGCSGIWSLNADTGGLMLEHMISENLYTGVSSNAIQIGNLFSNANEQLLFSWYDPDSATYGVDLTAYQGNGYYYQPSYGAYIETSMLTLGDSYTPRTLQEIEINLATNLNSGEGVRVSYRKEFSDAYIVIATFDYANFGAMSSRKFNFGQSFQNVQFKFELTTGAASLTTPQLNSITMK